MKILITAGPTREAIDPVRFISNRSSGRMGYALAQVAVERGHSVRLISGPTALQRPAEPEFIPVISAADMLAAVMKNFGWCDALIMSAAVADWRPKNVADRKLKKAEMSPVLELERTADILQAVAEIKQNRIAVGFAAETDNMLAEARRKLHSKRLDLIVANDVSRADAGFEVDTNAVTLVSDEAVEELPLMSKRSVAEKLIEHIERIAARL